MKSKISNLLVGGLVALAACSPGSTGNQDCVSGVASVGGDQSNSSNKASKIVFNGGESVTAGGVVSIYLDKKMTVSEYWPSKITDPDNFYLNCAAFFDFSDAFNSVAENDMEVIVDPKTKQQYVPITLWTAKHCIRPEIIDHITMTMKGHDGIPLRLKFVEVLKGTKKKFEEKYPSQQYHPTLARMMNTFYHAYEMNADYMYELVEEYSFDSATPVKTENTKAYLRADGRDILAMGRRMCPRNTFGDFKGAVNSYSSDDPKLCFLTSDLGGYAALVPVTTTAGKVEPGTIGTDEVTRIAQKQIETITTLGLDEPVRGAGKTSFGYGFFAMKKFLWPSLSHAVSVVDILEDSSIPDEEKNLLKESMAIGDDLTKWMYSVTDAYISAHPTKKDILPIMEDVLGNIHYLWRNVIKVIAKEPNKLMLSTNIKEKDTLEYRSNPLGSYTNYYKGSPGLIARHDGFLAFGKSFTVNFDRGDSGSMLSFNGILPLTVLSTVNDIDTSGGVAHQIYQTASEHDKNTDLDDVKEVSGGEDDDLETLSKNDRRTEGKSDTSGEVPIANRNESSRGDLPRISDNNGGGNQQQIERSNSGGKVDPSGRAQPIESGSVAGEPANCL